VIKQKIENPEFHRVASTAIINRNGKYLILQRSPDKKTFPGKWTVPGGGLEIDDYINLPKTTPDAWYFAVENSLRREIKEETGLDVGELKYLLSLTFIRPDNIPVVTLSYYCNWKSGDVRLDKDNIDYKWVTYEEAKEYNLIEGILEEMEMVDNTLKGVKLNKEKMIARVRNKYHHKI